MRALSVHDNWAVDKKGKNKFEINFAMFISLKFSILMNKIDE